MWYGIPGPGGRLLRSGGAADLKRLPQGGVELTEAQYQQLKADPQALWYRNATVQTVDPVVVLADAKARVKVEIDALRDIKIEAGFTYAFPDGINGTVQMRLSRDVLNITGLGSAAAVIAQQGGTDPLEFHDGENQSHAMTPSQVLDMALAAQVFYSACYAASWAQKAVVDGLSTLAEVEAFDPAVSVG